MRGVLRSVVFGALGAIVGCSRPLPDPDAPGARIYRARCGTCHPLHEPRSLTAAMWEIQVQKMRETMRRGGDGPLSGNEETVLLEYLRAHATDAGGPS